MALPVRASEDVASATTVAAMTVPGFEPKPELSKDHSLFSMKKVEGQVLLSAESYTDAAPFEGGHDDDEDDDGVELMYSLKHSDLSRHPKMAKDVNCFFTNNSSPSLRRNVRAWCDATGLSTTISIGCKGRVFHLHKFPLVSRSGYFKKVLKDATEVTLPSDVPGGAEIFELVSNFCYGSTILMEPANITELCCAADYFQMTEDYGSANLGERSELYLSQVALQSWDDTLVVLQHCEKLTPHAEKLGIDRRCLDSLAFMACMEAMEPVARKLGDAKALQCLHWWVQDLVALPPRLFVKLVLALRREGMKENCVGQVITAFADRWIFDFHDGPTEKLGYDEKHCVTMPEPDVLIKSVVKLLPLESYVVPIGFLFALLRRGLACSLSDESRVQLETRIVLQLETASLHDLLLPGKKEEENKCVFKNELESMERILKMFLSRIRAVGEVKAVDVATQIVVAKLWDQYLAEIAFDSRITPARFADLIERVPGHLRTEHDNVYRAIHAYLKSHPTSTQAERLTVCRTLNCQKLSPEACAHAVQSEVMPLRMIVQAMFMQQLQTRSVLDSHLESSIQSLRESPVDVKSHSQYTIRPDSSSSLRVNHSRDCFRSMGSSFRKNDLPVDDGVYVAPLPTPAVQQLKKEISHPSPGPEYEATESRLRSLEAELSRMRKSLVRQAAASGSARQVLESPRNVTENLITQHDRLKTPCRMATVHEVEGSACSSGYMNQLKPGTGTSPGLLAKALQKLKFPSFRKTSNSKEHTSSARPGRLEPDLGRVGRTDSMPRPITTSRVKQSRHARRNSMS